MTARLYVAGAAVAGVVLTGCGSETPQIDVPNVTGTSGAQVQVGNTINYGSFGTTADIDCADGKSLNIGGSNNTLTVRGTCASVNIGGADNKVTFDRIDQELSVVGLNNNVTYRDGEPAVTNTGANNTINKG